MKKLLKIGFFFFSLLLISEKGFTQIETVTETILKGTYEEGYKRGKIVAKEHSGTGIWTTTGMFLGPSAYFLAEATDYVPSVLLFPQENFPQENLSEKSTQYQQGFVKGFLEVYNKEKRNNSFFGCLLGILSWVALLSFLWKYKTP